MSVACTDIQPGCKQASQCGYNVTLMCVLATGVTAQKISATYPECVFVASVTQHAARTRHIATCGLNPIYNIFPNCLTNGTV